MLEMLAAANAAYAVIKKTVENGREISAAGAAIGKFVGAEDQLQQDLHKRKNSMWTNFLGKQDNDLEEFMALEEIRRKKEQLREFMQLYGRPNLYTDYLEHCSEARKRRKQAAIDRQKRKEKIEDIILKSVLGVLITTLLAGGLTVLVIIAKKKGII
jgi:hypothetical protein|tara:strand:- start:955 stop:1425 length:471 start_codon:yes stop_codon:yes gene_type:complete